MENLISNTSFGDYLRTKNIPDYEYRYLRDKFDEFLKQPLELWMFVPCKLVDDVWVVLECPHNYIHGKTYLGWEKSDYSEAKDRVLFEGFEITENAEGDKCILTDYSCIKLHCLDNACVEDLVKYSFKLSPTALKQIGL